MGGSLKYAVRTALALSVLEILVTSGSAAGRVGSAFDGLANGLAYLMSPAYPLVPDRRKATTTASPSSDSGSSSGSGSGGGTLPIPLPLVSATPPTSTGVISV